MFGIGGLALVIIIAAAASFSGITDGPPKTVPPINTTPISLSIQTDLDHTTIKI